MRIYCAYIHDHVNVRAYYITTNNLNGYTKEADFNYNGEQ